MNFSLQSREIKKTNHIRDKIIIKNQCELVSADITEVKLVQYRYQTLIVAVQTIWFKKKPVTMLPFLLCIFCTGLWT